MTIRIGAYENTPKIFTDEKGNWIGFWPDIVKYIATQEQWKIEYVEGTWTECLTRLEGGEIDLMPDMAYSYERSLLYDFNNHSVFSNWGVIYGTPPLSLLSFSDLEVCILLGYHFASRSCRCHADPNIWCSVDDHSALITYAHPTINASWFIF